VKGPINPVGGRYPTWKLLLQYFCHGQETEIRDLTSDDRDLGNPFGSEGYAREELRAEIARLILGSEFGIGCDPAAHAGYVDHWVQILTDTPKAILYAAADANQPIARHRKA
jgi:antirestriction protein ArdC